MRVGCRHGFREAAGCCAQASEGGRGTAPSPPTADRLRHPLYPCGRCICFRAASLLRTGKTKAAPPAPPITLSDAALAHLKKLREDSGDKQLLLRMGVKSGGCSGMSCEGVASRMAGTGCCCTSSTHQSGFIALRLGCFAPRRRTPHHASLPAPAATQT